MSAARSFHPLRCPSSPGAATMALAIALTASLSACGKRVDDAFCDSPGCGFSDDQWQRLQSLTGLPSTAPPDPSNAFAGNRDAVALGHKMFFDPRFSGPATQVDALGRPSSPARAPKGQPTGISCVSCHELARGGADVTSIPGNVSIGAGWTDVNSLGTINSAFHRRLFWNGRVDSQWALAVAVGESPTTMNGNRLQTAWVIADNYRDAYDAVFGPAGYPLPLTGTSADVAKLVETDGARAGQCRLDSAGNCPAPCVGDATSCWPRFPLKGKPGATADCQAGNAGEPFGDAFDCMAKDDQTAVTRVLVNWAKALAAYEAELITGAAPFDRFMQAGPSSKEISPAAQRGAGLFVGKAACIDCHATPFFSDDLFHDIGVPQAGPAVPTLADCPAGGALCDCPAGKKCLPFGAWDGTAKLNANVYRRGSVWSDDPDKASNPDVTLDTPESLKGAWRTPSLRNVALTAPYMHDGFYRTLEDVIDHYNNGPEPNSVGTPAADIKPLRLTPSEAADLVEFLKTLTGDPPPAELLGP